MSKYFWKLIENWQMNKLQAPYKFLNSGKTERKEN